MEETQIFADPGKAFAFLPAASIAIRKYVHTATANLPGEHRTLLINIKQWRAPNVGMLYNTVSDVEEPYLPMQEEHGIKKAYSMIAAGFAI